MTIGERPMGSINAVEAAICVGVTVLGAAILTGLGDSTSVQRSLPPVLVAIWAGLYAAGGLVALAGLTWPGSPWTGVEINRVGLAAIVVGATIYGAAGLYAGTRGIPVGTLNLAVAAGASTRIWQVTSRIRAARNLLRSNGGGQEA